MAVSGRHFGPFKLSSNDGPNFTKKSFLAQTDFLFYPSTLKENYCEKFEDFHFSFLNWVPGSYRDSYLKVTYRVFRGNL
jgi:hypothetical protein